jgi:hypothetical protein
VSCILDAITCRKYPHFLDVTPCYWLIAYRPFGINLHTRLHGAIYSLIIVPLGMRILGCLETSSANYQVTRRRLAQLLMVRWRGFYCGKGKTVRCRTSLCFVVTAVQIHTDMLGLYCNVNRQVMKLDGLSVFR